MDKKLIKRGLWCKVWDRETKKWLRCQIVSASVLRDICWVSICYPDGTMAERPRNIVEMRMLSDRRQTPQRYPQSFRQYMWRLVENSFKKLYSLWCFVIKG